MKVRLIHSTVVRFEEGTVVDVTEQEAKRLIAFNLAKVEEEKPKAKKSTKKAEK